MCELTVYIVGRLQVNNRLLVIKFSDSQSHAWIFNSMESGGRSGSIILVSFKGQLYFSSQNVVNGNCSSISV